MPGFGEQMRQISLRFVPTAILSRQVAVIRGRRADHQPARASPSRSPRRCRACPSTAAAGIFAAVPYCIDLIGGPYLETDEAVCKAFRPKNARTAAAQRYLTSSVQPVGVEGLGGMRILRHAVGRRQFARTCRELLDGLPQQRDLVLVARRVVDQALHGLRHRVVALRHAVGRKAHLAAAASRADSASACMMRAGLPTAVAPGGTGLTTTAPEPTRAPSPTVKPPSTWALAPTITPRPKVGWRLAPLSSRGAAQGHALVDRALVAHLGRFADHHAHAVVDEHPPAHGGAGVDLDAGEKRPRCDRNRPAT
jgi:hypothetical protein